MYDFFISPFVDFLFMRRALMACMGIAISCGPVGVFLVLRRMSLVGDALSHAILPGIAVGYLLGGLWLPGLTVGGVAAGMIVSLTSGFISRRTILAEDASFTGFYVISLALGIFILSVKGGNMNLMHFLFGGVLAVDEPSLFFIIIVSILTLLILILVHRPLTYDCFDPLYGRIIGINGGFYHLLFLSLVVINLVAACQALGTLMALGIMMLPAITARLLYHQIWSLCGGAILFSFISSYSGLLLSFYLSWPAGPTIILICGLFYAFALLKISFFQKRLFFYHK